MHEKISKIVSTLPILVWLRTFAVDTMFVDSREVTVYKS